MNGNFTPYPRVEADILVKTANHADFDVKVANLVGSMTDPGTVKNGNTKMILGPNEFNALVKNHLGYPPSAFGDERLSLPTKMALLNELARPIDDTVIVRANGNVIAAILSDKYTPFGNATLAKEIRGLLEEGLLPSSTEVMSYYISPDGRKLNMRLVSPEWDFYIGENGGSIPFYGNLIISNDELGNGSFWARSAITRTTCTNSTIGQRLFSVEHRFASTNDFRKVLHDSVGHISAYVDEMAQQMRNLQNVTIDLPGRLFEALGKELRVGGKALKDARKFWEENGEGNTLYDIQQAFSAGAQAYTTNPRTEPNWALRSHIENLTWTVTQGLFQKHLDGEDIEEIYLTDQERLLDMAARWVEAAWQEQVPEAVQIADGIRNLNI